MPTFDQTSEGPAPRAPGDLLHGSLTRQIIGAAFEVHNVLGAGFLEAVSASALTIELRNRGLAVDRNVPFMIMYRGASVGRYVADLIVAETVLVETKAGRALEAAHRAQVLNYLRASGLELGLLLNFGTSVQFKRVISFGHVGTTQTRNSNNLTRI